MTKEEAIKHLHTYSFTKGSGLTTQDQHEEAKKMAIKALETQPGWIPVTDRLPDKSGLYLVTEHTAYGVEVYSRYWNLRPDGSFWSGWHGDEVLAWQPLPKPWEGGQNGRPDGPEGNV